jgi:hypothetical protein
LRAVGMFDTVRRFEFDTVRRFEQE